MGSGRSTGSGGPGGGGGLTLHEGNSNGGGGGNDSNIGGTVDVKPGLFLSPIRAAEDSLRRLQQRRDHAAEHLGGGVWLQRVVQVIHKEDELESLRRGAQEEEEAKQEDREAHVPASGGRKNPWDRRREEEESHDANNEVGKRGGTRAGRAGRWCCAGRGEEGKR